MTLGELVIHDCLLPDVASTTTAAGKLSALCRPGDVFCLFGSLGAGKTTFARGFLRALGVLDDIPSPTFNLLLTYDTAIGSVWHFDLYRLNTADEVYELGFEDAIVDGICLIEWPDRLDGLLPENRVEIHLSETRDNTCRQLRLHAVGTETDRWLTPW